MPAVAAVIAVFLSLQVLPSASHAIENKEESRVASLTEAADEEDDTTDDDGSNSLTDRYMHLEIPDIEPLSREEEETLLGNWGDSDAEDGD